MRTNRIIAGLALGAMITACGGAEDPQQPSADIQQDAIVASGMIYGDALASGWSDASTAVHDLANASPVASGALSIAVDFAPSTTLAFKRSHGVRTSATTNVELDVNGGSTAGKALAVYATVHGSPRTKAPLAQYCAGGTIPANAWTHCVVPLSALGAASTTIDSVGLQESAGLALSRTYVDTIAFSSGSVTAPSAPTGLVATPGTGAVNLAWNAVSGAAGYNVYRSGTSGGTYAKLTSTSLAAPGYQDVAVTAGSTYWYAVSAVNSGGESALSAPVSATVAASAPPPPSTANWIYQDAMTNPWVDSSWCARSLSVTSPVEAGSDAISAQMNAWEGLFFTRSAFAPDAGSSLTFYVNGGPSGAGAALRVRAVLDSINGSWTSGVDLGPACEGGSIPANAWVRCTIPMSSIAPAGAMVAGVAIQEWSGMSLPTLYFDNIDIEDATSTPPPPQVVSVTVAPSSASIATGQSIAFTATVAGSTNTAVTWSVTEGAAGGTVTSSGVYTAPASAGTYHVVATSAADTTKSATATVAVTAAPPPAAVAVSVSPQSASIQTGSSVSFTATVTGSTNTAVTWSVPEGTAGGTVTSSGVYTAPASAGTYHVVATSAADASKSATATVTVSAPSGGSGTGTSILPSDRLTEWNPGLNAVGGIPNRTTICQTVNPSGGDDTSAIQAAIDGCAANQVVQLGAGTFRISGQGITLGKSNVTLRGSGAGSTKLVKVTGTSYPVIIIGPWEGWGWGNAVNLTADGLKGDRSVQVASATGFSVGALVEIDQVTDPTFTHYNLNKSPPGDASRGWFNRMDRPVGQVLEVASISGTTITFTTPLHTNFRVSQTAQLVPVSSSVPTVKYSGVENLYVSNGEGGDSGGNIHFYSTAYSWVKNVESAYSGGGSVVFDRTFRCVLRDSYLHDPEGAPVQGGGAYGLVMNWYASDNLVENNIVLRYNKVMVMRATGGGNVIGYNYMDDGTNGIGSGWMETGLNASHMTTPHYELFEGNQSFNFDGDNTWGGSAYITVFRNHLTGHMRTWADTGNRRAAGLMTGHWWYSFVGNVLGYPSMPLEGASGFTYENITYWSNNPVPMWELQYDPGNNQPDTKVMSTIIRDGNWDYATNSVHWMSGAQTLPDSLYLTSKPAFFGANPWPWVDAVGATKFYTLPARARYDAGTPNQP